MRGGVGGEGGGESGGGGASRGLQGACVRACVRACVCAPMRVCACAGLLVQHLRWGLSVLALLAHTHVIVMHTMHTDAQVIIDCACYPALCWQHYYCGHVNAPTLRCPTRTHT